MIKVNVYASGSAGNCVIINDELIIDAGAKCGVVGRALLLTHNHTDHTKYIGDYGGTPIYTSDDVADKVHARFPYLAINTVAFDQPFVIKGADGTYHVQLVRLQHDVPCVGFDIVYKDERILYATDFHEFLDEIDLTVYTALYLECNNTLSVTNLMDVFFGEQIPRDEFHRRKSFYNHCNVNYLIDLFQKAGYSEDNRCEIPLTLLHKSSYYYLANSERIVELCKIANVKNPLLELIQNGSVTICSNLNDDGV